MKLSIHTPCDVISKQETNSTSMVKVASKICYTLLHDTAPLKNMKMCPYVDLYELIQPSKFESK